MVPVANLPPCRRDARQGRGGCGRIRRFRCYQTGVAAIAFVMASGALATGHEPIAGNPLVEIPAGPFVFGSDDGPENERPRRVVEGRAFAINRTEITNRQYGAFVAATGHRRAFYADHPILGLADRPVVGVSWSDADAFCRHYGLALPSEQQYERAARGVDGNALPWGTPNRDEARANIGAEVCCSGDDRDGYPMTAPADAFASGASPDGVLNLIGNVWEWTSDVYAPYTGASATAVRHHRVLRGGSWNSDARHTSTTYRLAYDPDFRFAANGGFRCVRSSP
ncbi:sulfatase modifying factor 2 [Sinorhizobium fredii USDA 257]|uniref:Sulfatase modifying factor 2 n=2 Tax=Sinorhizobium/Ensifer group TaxID=227292 RepID=I3X2M4_SINF2|nr:sulfatase modifying factor 2 [Sinorhizobium fredii USDA 257]